MATLTAMYLDLTDPQSAVAWSWLQVVDPGQDVEIRPFCLSVLDPWECSSPPLALELLMLLELARAHAPEAATAIIDVAFDQIGRTTHPAARDKPHVPLATWLAVWSASGLSLEEYDEGRERLLAEVGYWQAQAVQEFGIDAVQTLLADDGTTIHLRLDPDATRPSHARRLWQEVNERLDAVSTPLER